MHIGSLAQWKQWNCENIYWNYVILKEQDWIKLKLCDSQWDYLMGKICLPNN